MKPLAVLLLASALAVPAGAADPTPRTLTVTGTGQVKAAPDEANFSTGVVAQGPTAREALAANSKAMAAVIASLKRQGVPDKAIQTANLSLNPHYAPCKPDVACPQKITGYEVSNTLTVTTAFEKAGVVLDALVASGANQIGGIAFAIHDPKPLLTAARAEAVKDAIEKASVYAKAAGVSLGPILSISEGGSSAPPQPMFKAYAMRAEAVPLAAGEQTVSADVSITWSIQ
jgi:uncharacterized protein YggE